MSRSLKLFTLFGTPVRVNYTWPIAPILITIALGTSLTGLDSPALTYGFSALIALWLVASILLHEFAHILVARRLGISTSGITLFALGGVSHIDEDETGPGKDLAVSIAGPLVSIALGLALGVVAFLLDAFFGLPTCAELHREAEEEYFSALGSSTGERVRINFGPCPMGPIFPVLLFNWLAIANIIIGLFNLLPLFPLDGGRILSAILWGITSNRQRGIRIAALVGQLGAAAMIAYGAYNLFFGELLIGVWFIAIGVFLMEAAVGTSHSRSP
ncbi:MAG: hypothetical protein F4X20_06280 [Dehalococcoidia bacterium]|nr:hypothetical protein [Dehalococcoidia bacterium]